MDVFISWSGHRSGMIARALAELLPDAIQSLKAWMSEHDIGAGARWGHELNRQLESSHFGVICLTPENIGAPWLLFEAGSLAKSVSVARVVPYRLKLSATDVPFPLAQFQGVDADEAGTKKLLQSLNAGLKQPMDPGRLDRVFQRWWPDLDKRIAAIPASVEGPEVHRPDRELLEEILKVVRDKARPAPSDSADPEAYSESKVPKSAIWKTVHDVKEADLARMTDEELEAYAAKVRERDRVTPHHGEETALFSTEQRVAEEMKRRKVRTSAEDIDAGDGNDAV